MHWTTKTIPLAFFLIQLFSPNPLKGEVIGDPLPPFALLTVPKSGSHLAMKALHFLTGGVPVWHTSFPSLYPIPSDEGFLYTHLCISPQLEDDYEHLPQLRKIINIRDLRDVCVSIVHQIRKAPWPGMTGAEREYFKSLSFDEQLLFVINYQYTLKEIALRAPNSLQVSVARLAEQAVRLSQDPRNLICRYEKMVGPLGGGTEEMQIEELRNIATFLGLNLSRRELARIADQLYGNEVNPFGKGGIEGYRSTFNRGQIGAWQDVFQEEHKAAFKENFGYALILLGYETDHNW